MQLKVLIEDEYIVSAIMKGERCSVEELLNGKMSAQYRSNCDELLVKIDRIARIGIDQFSKKLSHEINKKPKIWEISQGDLRLIYFSGEGRSIVICTDLIIKKSQKVEDKVVNKAIESYKKYQESIKNKTIIEIRESKNVYE